MGLRASLKTQRAASGEKIFRQSKQKTARIVDPMRRFFVTNDGKDSVDSLCGEFLEMPSREFGGEPSFYRVFRHRKRASPSRSLLPQPKLTRTAPLSGVPRVLCPKAEQ